MLNLGMAIARFRRPVLAAAAPDLTILLLKMDSGDQATTFTDSSPIGATVQTEGPAKAVSTPAVSGESLDLTGSTLSGLYIPPEPEFLLDGDFTVEFWIRSGGSPYGRVIDNGQSTYGGGFLVWHSGGTFSGNMTGEVSFSTSGSYIVGTRQSINDSAWHHVAFVRTIADGVIKCYFDGTLTDTGSYAGTQDVFPVEGIRIGRRGDGSTSGSVNGHLDLLRISRSAVYTGDFTPPVEL